LLLCLVQVNKDDLLSMVRYGAELVFSSEATNITGEGVERIVSSVGGQAETLSL
jgi:SWI/SNF-related matrix-associated actin-dependent regulator of chromatin subfamily A member 5